ncbi:hypothetical protein [Photobacterium leiognathi]|uniref:hypothetical protein n=1 Tax=Photobacterium leiognathi TaxID=553611 RepID=UPI0029825666|nr:hypothetical protein [Photobacterium leiognathi]
MQSKIPLPTDNIYKFYALFGLLLLFASTFAFLSIHHSYNEQGYKNYVELKVLEELPDLTKEQEARKFILEKQNEISISDKKFFLDIIGFSVGVSIILIVFGFFQWHAKIQPIQDEIVSKQLEKLDVEIKLLKQQQSRSRLKK